MNPSPDQSWTRRIMDGVRTHEEERALQLPSPARYERLEEIGRGGMGIVFRAYDRELKRPVALKLLREEGAHCADSFRRFRREGEAAARLSHSNIVPVFDVGEVEGRPFLVMEFVEGVALDAFLARRSAPIRERVTLLAKVSDGVAYAHAQGVVHRDLKPGNILIPPTGEPKVLDFGLAHVAASPERYTATRDRIGTPAYMAPEQVRGGGKGIGPPTDVYALGVILYGMITDRLPFAQETPDALYHAILEQDPPSPRKRNGRIHPDLETICLKAMEKDPLRRYPTAREFRDDLNHFLAGEPIDARPPGRLDRFRRVIARRRIGVATLAGAILAGILALVGMNYYESRRVRSEDLTSARAALQAGNFEGALILCGRHPSSPAFQAVAREAQSRIDERIAEAGRRAIVQERLTPARVKARETYLMSFHPNPDYWRRSLEELEILLQGLEDLAQDPAYAKYADLWTEIGIGRWVANDPARAEKALLRAREIAPGDRRVCLHLAKLCFRKAIYGRSRTETESRESRLEACRAAFRFLDEGSSGDAPASTLESHMAQTCLAVAEERFDDVVRLCKEGRERFRPFPERVEYWIIECFVLKGNDAIAAYTEALRERAHYSQAFAGRGFERTLVGDHSGAVEDWTRCIELTPRDPAAYNGRGVAWHQFGNYGKAVADYSRALELDPGIAQILANRGVARCYLGDRDGALHDLEEAIRIRPDDPEVYMNRGTVRAHQGDWDRAEADFSEALRLQPNDAALFENRGMARRRKRHPDLDGAIEDFRAAVGLAPRNAHAHACLGSTLSMKNDANGAIRALDTAIDLDAGVPAYFTLRGMAKALNEDRSGANQDFDQAIRLAPGDPEPFMRRGQTRRPWGDLDGSIQDLEQALRVAPSDWTHRALVASQLEDVRKEKERSNRPR